MTVFYNDFDARACATLREMIGAGLITDGDVDGRDVVTLQSRELAGYNRVHIFAGIGGFEIAARLAGWPDDRQLWTGGFPCQPFSVAGSRGGTADDRYLWPEFFRLIRGCRPEFVLIENVAAIDSEPDLVLDRVLSDLEALGYETWAAEIPACAVDAAHERNRVWVMAYCSSIRREELRKVSGGTGESKEEGRVPESAGICGSPVAHRAGERWGEGRREHAVFERGNTTSAGARAEPVANCHQQGPQERRGIFGNAVSQRSAVERGCAGDIGWISCHDGRFRRIPLGLLDPSRMLVDGLPSRTLALHGIGNSIVPQVAAEILRAACPS